MSTYQKPLPDIKPWTRPFWDGTQQGKLLVQKCTDCNVNIFSPKRYCPECWSEHLVWFEASGKAQVFSYTITYSGVEPFFENDLPLILAWVDLEEPGVRMLTNIVDCDPEDVEIGMDLQVTFEAVTPDVTLPKFKPA